MKTIHLSLFCLGLALFSMAAYGQTQTVKLTTARSMGQPMTIYATSLNGVAVDWGDGNPISYTTDEITGTVKDSVITITGDEFMTGIDASGCDLTAFNINQAPNLLTFYVSDNQLKSASLNSRYLGNLLEYDCSYNNLSSLSFVYTYGYYYQLKSLNCSHNDLSTINTNNLNYLERLVCDSNKISSLTIRNWLLKTMWCSDNMLSSLDVEGCDSMASIVCYDNRLTSLEATYDSIEDLWCSGNKLTDVDASTAHHLYTIDCDDNGLTSLKPGNPSAANPAYLISCCNNKLMLDGFAPAKNVKHYFYNPQDTIHLDFTSVNVQDYVDLSKYIKNSMGTNIGKLIFYNAITGEQLQSGLTKTKDYYAMNGNTRFWQPFEKVYFVVTATQYPGLAIPSTAFSVVSPDGINAVTTDEENAGGQLYDLQGRKAVTPQRGVYIKNGKKVLIK
jgi:hypothetical protein